MEIIPAGVAFKLRIELRDVSDSDEQLLAAGLSEWEEGRLRLGGRVSRDCHLSLKIFNIKS